MFKPVFFRSPRIGSRRAAPQMSDSSRGAEGGTKGASGWSRAGGHRTGLEAGARSAPEARSRCWAGSPRRGGLRGARRVRAAPRVRRPSLPEAAGGRDDAAAHGRRRCRREPVARPAPPTPLGCGRLVAAGAALAGDSDSRGAAALGPRPVPRGDRAGPPPSGVVHGRGLQPAWKPAELIGFSQCKHRDETGHRVIISERSYFIMFDQFLARF